MLEIGDRLIDRYQLQEKLGHNASRQTWLAVDTSTHSQERAIIKLLAFNPQTQWDETKLFEREAQVLKSLDHPRIPKYKDYFLLKNLPNSRFPWFVLVQSYIAGKSLQQLLDEGQRFTQEQVEKIAIEVLNILVYLHSQDPPLLHRDIKPSNLIWGEDEQVYLVDFGAVQDRAATEGVTFTVVGTYGYVPMEQFAGRAVPSSDLYALGTTLIHLLTGTAPADLPYNDARILFADRVNIDMGLVNWLGKLTEPNVTERISTASQALKALKDRNALISPITSSKPFGSHIKIEKSASQLKIQLPRRGGKAFKVVYLLGVIGSFGWFIYFYLGSLNPSTSSISHYTFSIWDLVPGLILIAVVKRILLPIFSQTDLYFDRENFEIRWKLWGICYWRRCGKTATIHRVYQDAIQHRSAPRGITIECRAYEEYCKQKITSSPIATVERYWLMKELGDWLGLESERSFDNWEDPIIKETRSLLNQ